MQACELCGAQVEEVSNEIRLLKFPNEDLLAIYEICEPCTDKFKQFVATIKAEASK